MAQDKLSITDNRTGKGYELPVEDGAIRAADLRPIKTSADDFGLMSYDPGYLNTASCRSRITYIDGDRGILMYRGYPIEQLAEHSTYLECARLVVLGELPSDAELAAWKNDIAAHAEVAPAIQRLIASFEPGSHPSVMMIAALASLSSHYPDARNVLDARGRMTQALRLIGQMPVLAASIYRHHVGQQPIAPDPALSYAGNFLRLMFAPGDSRYAPSAALERALDVLLILHLDHEQNCSTSVLRAVASAHSDLFCAAAAAKAALYGPLHGGANEEVLRMLWEIGRKENVPEFIRKVKDRKALLMGFGHRVYKNVDPRAKIIKRMADAVFSEVGRSPLIDIALELEGIALSDDFFISRKLYPNVDFYSGLIYEALKIPPTMFTVMFALGRASGWAAHYLETMDDKEQKIARPRQIYDGARRRDYVTVAHR